MTVLLADKFDDPNPCVFPAVGGVGAARLASDLNG